MKRIITILVILLVSVQVFPQDTLTRNEKKKLKTSFLLKEKPWTVELPIWVPGFAGEFAYGDVDIEGDDGVDIENPIEPPESIIGKIISRLFKADWYLRFFFLTRAAYEKDRLLFQFDAISANVGNTVKFTSSQNQKELVDTYFRAVYLRFMGGYKIYETTSANQKFRYELFGYTGVRMFYHSVRTQTDNGVKVKFSPTTVEPVLGIQNQFTWKRWMVLLQGDYGGLFIKDKSSSQLSFLAYYRMGKLNSLKFGWNHLQLDQAGDFRGETYHVKTTLSGPTIGLAFHF